MANQAAKKQAQSNAKLLQTFLYGSAGVTIFHLLFNLIFFFSSFGFWSVTIWIAFTLSYVFFFSAFASLGRASYVNGELVSAGADLGGKGLTEYAWDVIYILWFTEVTGVFSYYFYLALLTVPGYAFFKAWNGFIYPWITRSANTEEIKGRKALRAEKKGAKGK
ncbi:putative opsin [Planoprotostelium fungivorum]|uniref:Putative opsin n=1 Tax=Planoprotostelium fungivorum TaxID=1890364 RepID=A0A2P6N3Z9_9EUKA|nr:putative opsin [Planoprotostelium fungivorum]